jgi:hypothetical protein
MIRRHASYPVTVVNRSESEVSLLMYLGYVR